MLIANTSRKTPVASKVRKKGRGWSGKEHSSTTAVSEETGAQLAAGVVFLELS